MNSLAPPTRFVRVTVAARYPARSDGQENPPILQWFWRSPTGTWTADAGRTLPIAGDGETHVYWTFLPTAAMHDGLGGLRFDPVNGLLPADVGWIALDWVR